MRSLPILFGVLLATALPAATQDFGTEWLDQVVHDRMPSKGPLPARPFTHKVNLGVLAYYDSNVTFAEEAEGGEGVFVPFLRLRMDYSEKQLDAHADILGAYKFYEPDSELSGDEERLYARVRYMNPKFQLQAEDIFMHVSDPLDAIFPDRAERITNVTALRGQLALSVNVGLEVNAAVGFVTFLEGGFEDLEHLNARPDVGLTLRLTNSMEGLIQAGAIRIDYSSDPLAPPDVAGFYVRGGARGELKPGLWLTALAGWTSAESDDFSGGLPGVEDSTLDAVLAMKWSLSQTVVVTFDCTRQCAFGGGEGEPFAVVNRALGIMEYQASEEWTWFVRAQYDFLDGALGSEREWFSFGSSLKWQAHPQVYLDGGATLRVLSNGGTSADFEAEDFIVHFGIVATN